MNGNCADIVRVSFEAGDLLRCIVVVYSKLEVVGAADEEVLARDEATGSHRDIGYFEALDDLLCLITPDVHMSGIQSSKDPGLGWVEVAAFHSLAASKQLSLDIELHFGSRCRCQGRYWCRC